MFIYINKTMHIFS